MLPNKYFAVAVLAGLFLSCSRSAPFDKQLLKKRTQNSNKGLIISCVRCNCVIADLERFSRMHPDVAMIGDSSCMTPEYKLRHLPQPTLDSIYLRNYNLILFKWEDRFSWRLIETKESLELEKIANEFFK